MTYTKHYEDMKQRNNLCSIATSNGFRMLHDDFDPDWERGDEPHGSLTFTDEPAPQAPEPEPTRVFGVEIDTLKARMEKLENR
ncbi:hypothetical protein ES703_32936 [subsurface metagenome]